MARWRGRSPAGLSIARFWSVTLSRPLQLHNGMFEALNTESVLVLARFWLPFLRLASLTNTGGHALLSRFRPHVLDVGFRVTRSESSILSVSQTGFTGISCREPESRRFIGAGGVTDVTTMLQYSPWYSPPTSVPSSRRPSPESNPTSRKRRRNIQPRGRHGGRIGHKGYTSRAGTHPSCPQTFY